MKRSSCRYLVIGLASLAALSVLGVGFASWVFKPVEVDSKQGSASVHVVSSVTKGSISILSSPEIVTFSQGVGQKDDLTDGISFYSKEESDGKVHYVENDQVTLRYEILDDKDSIEGNSWRLFIAIEDETFSDYVSLTSTYSQAEETLGGFDFSSNIKSYPSSGDENAYFEYTLCLNEAIQYKSKDVKPLTESAYSSLYSALNASSCKITVKFVVV